MPVDYSHPQRRPKGTPIADDAPPAAPSRSAPAPGTPVTSRPPRRQSAPAPQTSETRTPQRPDPVPPTPRHADGSPVHHPGDNDDGRCTWDVAEAEVEAVHRRNLAVAQILLSHRQQVAPHFTATESSTATQNAEATR